MTAEAVLGIDAEPEVPASRPGRITALSAGLDLDHLPNRDISSGAVAVVSGALLEHNLGVGADHVRTVVPEGSVFSFAPDHIHRLTGEYDGSVSVQVSYADELRPLEDASAD